VSSLKRKRGFFLYGQEYILKPFHYDVKVNKCILKESSSTNKEDQYVITTLVIYLIIMNVVNFILMGYDKKQAKKGSRRIPEKRFFTYAAFGGALGGWLGMLKWRHKTKHMSFVLGLPALLVVNIICMYFLWIIFPF
jgi:uncharacterized membrane protein YsdA (DUF1294 family)